MRVALVLLIALGCYAPHPSSGAPCQTTAMCPDGLVCSPASGTCELTAVDARVDVARDSAPTIHDAPADAATTPMLIQYATSYASPSVALAVTLPAAPAMGHVLVLIGGNPHAGFTSVTGAGATWARAAISPINDNVEIWLGVTDGSSATLTVTDPGSTAPMSLLLTEWSGLAAANTLDAAAVLDGTTSPANAGTIVTTNPRDLVVFAISDTAPDAIGVPGPGTWTALPFLDHAVIQEAWYLVANTTGSFSPAVSETAHTWDAALVGLRAAP